MRLPKRLEHVCGPARGSCGAGSAAPAQPRGGGFRRPAVKVLMPDESEAPAGVFTFPGEHAVIRKGFRSDWWTALPDAGRGSGLPAAIH